MAALKKIGGAYLVLVAVAVGGFFIINPWVADAGVDTTPIWLTLDVLMALALLPALDFNFRRKLAEGRRPAGSGDLRRYLGANVAFYATVAVAILFFHAWFSLLAAGTDYLGSSANAAAANHQAWVIWAAVDTLLPIVIGATGIAMWLDDGEGT